MREAIWCLNVRKKKKERSNNDLYLHGTTNLTTVIPSKQTIGWLISSQANIKINKWDQTITDINTMEFNRPPKLEITIAWGKYTQEILKAPKTKRMFR